MNYKTLIARCVSPWSVAVRTHTATASPTHGHGSLSSDSVSNSVQPIKKINATCSDTTLSGRPLMKGREYLHNYLVERAF